MSDEPNEKQEELESDKPNQKSSAAISAVTERVKKVRSSGWGRAALWFIGIATTFFFTTTPGWAIVERQFPGLAACITSVGKNCTATAVPEVIVTTAPTEITGAPTQVAALEPTAIPPTEPTATPQGGSGQIAFASIKDMCNAETQALCWEIYLLDITNNTVQGDPRQLTNGMRHNLHPAWSLDGTHIVFQQTDQYFGDIFLITDVEVNPVAQRQLTNDDVTDLDPSFSPDGCSVAFVTYRANKDIVLRRTDGSGDPAFLTDSSSDDVEPAWSPDGTKIAFTSYRDAGYPDIWLMNPDGAEQTNLTQNNNRFYSDVEPAWSPDGTMLAFASDRDGYMGIYIYNLTDGSTRQLTIFGQGSNRAPNWSPDGNWIAFQSDRDNAHDEIYVMDTNGGQLARLTTNEYDDRNPVWRPVVGSDTPAATNCANTNSSSP